jgi:hypothetical protein
MTAFAVTQKGKKMDDLISRQALCEYALNQKDKSVTPNDIMRFPSAQTDVTDINVGDTISRQQAIDGMRKLQRWNVVRGYNKNEGFLYDDVMYLLEKLPSAQPTYTDEEIQKMADLEQAEIEKAYQLGYEDGKKDAQSERKKSTWGADGECPFCGYLRQWNDDNFCGNCGADMRGEQDE